MSKMIGLLVSSRTICWKSKSVWNGQGAAELHDSRAGGAIVGLDFEGLSGWSHE